MSVGRRRAVITGAGVVTPFGNTAESLWEGIRAARSAVAPLSAVPSGAWPIAFGAEARDFQGRIEDFGPLDKEKTKAIRKGLKVMCRECQMGVAAAQRALADAALPGTLDPERIGISFGSDYMITLPEDFSEGIRQCLDAQGRFDFTRWATEGMPKMSPLWLLKYLPNMPASHLAIYNDLRGPNNSLTMREAAPHVALGQALQTILQDRADVMVVGSTGTRLHPLKTLHAQQQEELAPLNGDPTAASRPFDRGRQGMVLGEGAGAIILEEAAHAQARGAPIYAEVLAGTSSSVIGARLTPHRQEALHNALVALLVETGTRPDEIGFLHAHGLGTRACDREEAAAINQVFGDRAVPLPVTAAKSYFGNLGAGSGMIELVAAVDALRQGQVFRTLNYRTPDPECPLNVVTEGQPAGRSFAALNVTPQGQASAALVARFEG